MRANSYVLISLFPLFSRLGGLRDAPKRLAKVELVG